MKNALLFGVVLGLFGLSSGAKATMMEQLDTNRLTLSSKSIFIGEVVNRWSSCEDADCKMIFTYVKLKVEKTLKGEEAQEVLIRIPGGQVKEKGIGIVVHGMASFSQGERTLVFLDQDKNGAPSLVGMSQGKFRIYKNHSNGEDMAMFQSPQNVEFFTHGQQGKIRHVVSSQVDRRVSLHNLIGEIRNTIAQEQRGL